MSINTKVILFALFITSFIFHLIGMNLMGRTWDEQYKVDNGYVAWDRLLSFDFSFDSWREGSEHPMVAKYTYGIFMTPHLIRLDNGNGGYANLPDSIINQILTGNYVNTILYDKLYAVAYDLTLPRVISAIFNSAAVALTALLARFLIKDYWYLAGIFLLLMPRFVAMGQLITYESISIFLMCLITLVFYKLLKNPEKTKSYLSLGLLCGLMFWTRYNNAVIFPFLLGFLIIHYLFYKDKKIFNFRLFLIPIIAFLFGIIIWPLMWHNFPNNLINTFAQHNTRGIGLSLYFWEHLLVTTPVLLLTAFLPGVFFALREKKFWGIIFLWWFALVMLFFTFLSVSGGGVRYIIVALVPVAILAVYGLVRLFKEKTLYAASFIAFVIIIEFISFFPYYLDYYNHFVGGAKGALAKGYAISWWGEGQREATLWLNKNAENNATVGYIVTPQYVSPKLRQGLSNKGYIDFNTDVDYIIINAAHLLNPPASLSVKYQPVYEVKVQETPLVVVYRKNGN